MEFSTTQRGNGDATTSSHLPMITVNHITHSNPIQSGTRVYKYCHYGGSPLLLHQAWNPGAMDYMARHG
ncbi:hypothetical protein BDV35DRAFT_385112 [Aspergillus flavus]|uniref:Uncharacterized protein n=1 Tax=Aspergillus flavus TaxID=5059 RepID=A0A5N6GJ42_ASPFL|nr:hypothetical protein BDV35DRAFT_385112 [Aspergillus flavus]